MSGRPPETHPGHPFDLTVELHGRQNGQRGRGRKVGDRCELIDGERIARQRSEHMARASPRSVRQSAQSSNS